MHLADGDGGSTELPAGFLCWDQTDLFPWSSPGLEHLTLQLGFSGAQGAHSPAVFGAAGPSSRSLLADEQSNAYTVDPRDLGLFGLDTLDMNLPGYTPVDFGVPAAFIEGLSDPEYQGEDGLFDLALSEELQSPVSDSDWTGVPLSLIHI